MEVEVIQITTLLNEPYTHYKDFTGKYPERMPELLREGYKPLSVADAMRRRIEVETSPLLREGWWDGEIQTIDGLLHCPNGKAKVVLDAKPLLTISRHSALVMAKLANCYKPSTISWKVWR